MSTKYAPFHFTGYRGRAQTIAAERGLIARDLLKRQVPHSEYPDEELAAMDDAERAHLLKARDEVQAPREIPERVYYQQMAHELLAAARWRAENDLPSPVGLRPGDSRLPSIPELVNSLKPWREAGR